MNWKDARQKLYIYLLVTATTLLILAIFGGKQITLSLFQLGLYGLLCTAAGIGAARQ